VAIQPVAWDDADLLEQNRQRLLKECRQRMRVYEARYELGSDRVETELAAGRLRETAEVCDWIITLHTYRAVQGES
jgi:hypothetical protein